MPSVPAFRRPGQVDLETSLSCKRKQQQQQQQTHCVIKPALAALLEDCITPTQDGSQLNITSGDDALLWFHGAHEYR